MKPYHRNPRQITKQRYARLTDTLARLGDLGGIVHNLNTDEIIGGNQRMAVFKDGQVEIVNKLETLDEQGTVALGFVVWQGKRYAYRQVRWDEQTAAEANIAANLGAGEWNADVLANEWNAQELINWGMDAAQLNEWKRDVAMLDNIIKSETPEAIDAEPQIDQAEELREKWKTERGQLWRIGEHRILCGDSTVKEDVERVMGGEKYEMLWTDPPYGVAVGDKNKYLNSIAPSNRVEENLVNDTLEEPELLRMLEGAFDNSVIVGFPGAAWYVAAPPGPLQLLFGQALKARGIWRQTIQWIKNNSTFSPMGVCYHWQAEPPVEIGEIVIRKKTDQKPKRR